MTAQLHMCFSCQDLNRDYEFLIISGTPNFGHCTVRINQREILPMNTLWEKFFRSLYTINIVNSTVYCGFWD